MSDIKVEEIGGAVNEVLGAFTHGEIYVGFLPNFETMTEPKERDGVDAATTLAELSTITANHTFKTGFGFTKIGAIQESIRLESSMIGEPKMSPAIENKLTVKILGSESDVLGFGRLCKGRDLIVLAAEAESGRLRQIGSAKFAAKLSEFSTVIEETSEGENAATYVFTDKQKYVAPIYSGDVTEQPPVV